MKVFSVLALCVSSLCVHANPNTFSLQRLEAFYEQFLLEEKAALAAAGIGTSASIDPYAPPTNPPPPAFLDGYLPIVLVNNSTQPDSDVWILVTGDYDGTTTQAFVQFDSSGVGTLVTAATGLNATSYSLQMSSLPRGSSGRVIYLPPIVGGAVWFSMGSALYMPCNGNSIVQPNFLSSSDPNYDINYDFFEFAYTQLTTPNIAADATAVSYYSQSLYGYISTPSSVNSNTGLYQPRSYVMEQVQNYFSAAPNASEWNSLVEKNGSTILRVVSPGKSMSASVFDKNYLDNSSSYGYSYLSNIWYGSGSYYKTHTPIVMTIPNGTSDTYHGIVNMDNTITFTSTTSPTYTVVFGAPTTSGTTTTQRIFGGTTLVTSDNSPGQADGVQLSKLFEEAIIASLVPTSNTLSNPYLAANQSSYYTFNSNLSTSSSTGPWYDLYSKALHSMGYIYTYAFDEPLWPQVQIFSNSLEANATYLGITLCDVE